MKASIILVLECLYSGIYLLVEFKMVTVSRFPRKVTLHSFRVLCILFLIQEEIFIWINNIDTSSGQSHILNPLISDLFVVQLLSHVRLFETP